MKLSLKLLEEIIKNSWDRKTCHYKYMWDDRSTPKSTGHCRVSALIIQDIIGGKILYSYANKNKKWDHYWNLLPSGIEIDLTSDQFPLDVVFAPAIEIDRKQVLKSRRTQKGYNLLRERVFSRLSNNHGVINDSHNDK